MNIIISNSSDIPIYQQIVKQIKEAIISNVLEQGQILPSIRTLAKDLNISVITTKRAYEELQRQGFVDIVAGKGCFVSIFKKELIYEDKLREIENKIEEVINIANLIGIKKEEIIEIFNLMYEGE